MDAIRLRFLGATETVTGSKYLLTVNDKNILVDCGLFQGLKELRLKNWDRFPVDPKEIEAIILTHGHIDHSGYIPRLIKEGFRGKVYCTKATASICKILLPDTGYLQEEEAEWMNRKKISKHHPALPLFSKEDAINALDQFHGIDFDQTFEIFPGFKVTFRYAGHILGAASAVIEWNSKKIGFSGDVGRWNDPIMYPPAKFPEVDYLIIESTYGNRQHPDSDPKEELCEIINETVRKKGVVLIPAFTVGRAQTILHYLAELRKENRISRFPMYLNSPMATNVTNLYKDYENNHKLSPQKCEELSRVVHYVKTIDESKAINQSEGPMLIVSASGMATGGRILHHLKAFAPKTTTAIVLAGYQAAGTRGRQIQDLAPEIKIHKELVPLKAAVYNLENISAHADYVELGKWVSESKARPKKIFVTHGELPAAEFFAEYLKNLLSVECSIPRQGQEFILN